jgi:energy-coupling factor transporter transmembrane protein EcfT
MLPALAIFLVVSVVLLPGLLGVLLAPVVVLATGYLARSYGRDFWMWLLLGCILPVVSIFLLLLLPDRSTPEKA